MSCQLCSGTRWAPRGTVKPRARDFCTIQHHEYYIFVTFYANGFGRRWQEHRGSARGRKKLSAITLPCSLPWPDASRKNAPASRGIRIRRDAFERRGSEERRAHCQHHLRPSSSEYYGVDAYSVLQFGSLIWVGLNARNALISLALVSALRSVRLNGHQVCLPGSSGPGHAHKSEIRAGNLWPGSRAFAASR